MKAPQPGSRPGTEPLAMVLLDAVIDAEAAGDLEQADALFALCAPMLTRGDEPRRLTVRARGGALEPGEEITP